MANDILVDQDVQPPRNVRTLADFRAGAYRLDRGRNRQGRLTFDLRQREP